MNDKIRKTVTAAVLAALVCAATLLVQIPMVVTKGYVNLGDCLVLAAGWLLGARWGFAAAATGSALADLITGYAIYAPGTFAIKGAMAVAAVLVAGLFGERRTLGRIAGGAAAEAIMIVGYFLYSWFVITGSAEASAPGIIGNLVQGAVGLVIGVSLMAALDRTKAVRLMKK